MTNLDRVIETIDECRHLTTNEVGYELSDEYLIAPDLPAPYINLDGEAEWTFGDSAVELAVVNEEGEVCIHDDGRLIGIDVLELEDQALKHLAAVRYAQERISLNHDRDLREDRHP